MTIDTIIPHPPKKLIQEPDDAKYHLEIDKMAEKIEKLNEEFKEKKAELYGKKSKIADTKQGRDPF